MWITKRIQGARQSIFFWLLLGIFTLSGCGTSSSPEATTMPPIELPTQAVATAVPTETAELTAAATPTTDVAPPPAPSDDSYLDDRSDPLALLHSLVNALNQHEYLRAYGYWEENAPNLPAYDTFAQGYAETESVQLQTGAVYVGAAAGNTYFEVPTILTAQTTGGETQYFVGCYRLHLASPGAQGALPFQPLGIQTAEVKGAATSEEAQAQLGQQCLNENGEYNGQPLPEATAAAADAISADRYLDDRSDGTQVLRSLFNAVNRHEYVRAYDYWQNQAALPSLDDFSAGYANTTTVQLLTGPETLDAGAGQRYSQVPVVLIAQTAAGATETFAGCYTLHLANPAIQGTPPFESWGIQAADIQQVANDADSQQLLAQSCAQN